MKKYLRFAVIVISIILAVIIISPFILGPFEEPHNRFFEVNYKPSGRESYFHKLGRMPDRRIIVMAIILCTGKIW